MIDTDRAWFKANPATNFRVRRPGPLEVEELLAKQYPDAVSEIEHAALAAALQGLPIAATANVPCPIPEHEWRVVVVRLPGGHLSRLLSVDSWNLTPEQDIKPSIGCVAFVLDGNLVISK